MNGTFRVIGGGFGAGELKHMDAAEIAELVTLGLQPDILDPRNFRGQVLDSGDGLFLVMQGSGVAEFVSHNVHHRFGLAEFVDGGNVARQPAPHGNSPKKQQCSAEQQQDAAVRSRHGVLPKRKPVQSKRLCGKRQLRGV
jgi:hypothetical protein